MRIGIAAGEPVDHNDDLFGSTVNLASRICDAVTLGTSSRRTSSMRWEPTGLRLCARRDVELKGFGPVRVFELVRPGREDSLDGRLETRARRSRPRLRLGQSKK